MNLLLETTVPTPYEINGLHKIMDCDMLLTKEEHETQIVFQIKVAAFDDIFSSWLIHLD
jgi:hypothetical protein